MAGCIRLMFVLLALAWPTAARAADSSRPAASGVKASDGSDRPALSSSSLLGGQPQEANFIGATPSKDARRVADWVMVSRDNGGLPFAVIDKIGAKVFVFDGRGRLRGVTFALLGAAVGDGSVAGIGSRTLSAIRPEERTTPAGRFVATLGRDLKQDILWIDYGASISLHRVIKGNPGDRRLQRLATTSVLDKRITYGCVNVPVRFYEDVVLATFTGTGGIVYILPETKKIQEVFAMADHADPS